MNGVNNAEVDAARLRGAAVGAWSAAMAVAAHGFAGGGIPGESSIVALILACAAIGTAVGAAVSSGRRYLVLVVALCAGQLVGHFALVLTESHAHGGNFSLLMLASHVVAAAACAALICSAERLYCVAASTLDQLIVATSAPVPVVGPLRTSPPLYRPSVVLRLLVSAGAGTRGPPA